MAQCKSCFTKVDGRSVIYCADCDSPIHKSCAINIGGASLCDMCFTVKETQPVSKFGEFDLPTTIRRTHIETYRKCPYKFFLEVIKGNEMPPNEYTQIGSDVHEIIEQAIQDDVTHQTAMTSIENIFNQYTDALFQNKSKEDMWKRATASIDTFYEEILPSISNVIAVEDKIDFPIGEDTPNANITMDLIVEKDGELEIHDWKTGKVLVGKSLAFDLQAPLYIYAVQQKFGKKVRKFKFHYLHENKHREFIRDEQDPKTYVCTVGKREYKVNLDVMINEIRKVFHRIKKGDFNIPHDTRKMYFTCKMCHLRKEGLCAGAEEEVWNQLN